MTLWINLFYRFSLALWLGGAACLTFLVTPLLASQLPRPLFSQAVAALFPTYFACLLGLSVLALVFLQSGTRDKGSFNYRWSLLILLVAITFNLLNAVVLQPKLHQIKTDLAQPEARDQAELKAEFGWLHGVSASLNLLVLVGGLGLFVLAPLPLSRSKF